MPQNRSQAITFETISSVPDMKRYLFFTTLFLLLSVGFWYFGRAFWYPFVHKFTPVETIESIKSRYEHEVWRRLAPVLAKNGISEWPKRLTLIGLKEERILEVWTEKDGEWIKIHQYPFTAYSGALGPKLREGDRQIPEGIYEIEYLNPNSMYHLSLKVSYPNDFDLQKAKSDGRSNLGGDIFIHGKSVTIGCIPIGDEAIEEVFLLAANARQADIQVIISPRDFRSGKLLPEIQEIAWTKELYEMIAKKLWEFDSSDCH
jgi:hypothetical protein